MLCMKLLLGDPEYLVLLLLLLVLLLVTSVTQLSDVARTTYQLFTHIAQVPTAYLLSSMMINLG
jgi:hypothetical protein